MYSPLDGEALMEIDGAERIVTVGDAILIPVGAWHQITNTGAGDLRFLCTCAPPRMPEDTYLLGTDGATAASIP